MRKVTAGVALVLVGLTLTAAAYYAPQPSAARVPVTMHGTTPPSTAEPPASVIPSNQPSPSVMVRARVVQRPMQAAAASRRLDRILIPRIGLNAVTFEGIDESAIDRGPSHWPGTADPGELGNSVFAGHRTTYTRPFLNLDRLRAGDEVSFERSGGTFTYHVTNYFVVSADAVWITDRTDSATFTLFTCHPKYSDRQRYVVVGKLVSAPAPLRRDGGGGPAPATTDNTIDKPTATSTTTTTTTRPCLLCVGARP